MTLSARWRSWRGSPLGLSVHRRARELTRSDQATPGHAARAGRLELRGRDRGRQASPTDELVLPEPRRGDVRRVPAADGRDRLEELPEDLARGNRRGQDQVPLPGVAPGAPPWPESS